VRNVGSEATELQLDRAWTACHMHAIRTAAVLLKTCTVISKLLRAADRSMLGPLLCLKALD
jgi:hypothetical protein